MKKTSLTRSLNRILVIMAMTSMGGFAQQIKSPQDYGAASVNFKNLNLSSQKTLTQLTKDRQSQINIQSKEPIAGQTFKAIAFDEQHGINRFTKKSANTFLERDLFNAPEYTATYYYARYDKNAVHVENSYIQLVSDSRWDRILFGSLQGVLKSYNDIKSPGEIEVNSAGRVFIAEKAKSRIQVLQITGKGESVDLEFVYAMENMGKVSSIAYNDGGTPFDLTDDFMFVADASANTITRINLSANSWTTGRQYTGFQWPVAITFGRWNGAHNELLYMIDNYGKKLSLLRLGNDDLTLIKEITANAVQNFRTVETDHFGQLYLADGVNSEIFKYNSDLNLLAVEKAQDNGIIDINIPFGTIEINGEKYWTGFDQAFVIQKWNDESGVQRYKLGIALMDFNISLSDDNASLKANYTMTEFANSRLQISDASGKTVYLGNPEMLASGENSVNWNRTNSDNQQTAPGYYELKLELQSLYDESIISQKAAFYLPLYYHIDCGAEDATPAVQKISGSAAVINGQSVSESRDKIEYKITGLNPDSEYKVAARFVRTGAEEKWHAIMVDGLQVQQSIHESGYVEVPKETFSDGEINIRINATGPGKFAVADIWLTESGREFTFADPQQALPVRYKLLQNYPNPFNPSTTIYYQLPDNGMVALKVFDVTGREVTTLVNGYQNAGNHQVVFNAPKLSSGIYFYKLVTDSFTETKKMVLLK